MPIQLLPASAAAFAPRSTVNIVLGSKAEPWLTQTLKRINRVKRPLNSVQQHTRCLTETLSGSNAIWSLCSIMVPKAPDSELRKDSNPLVEAIFNYQVIHIEAYVVHVDMVSQHEVAFKLTPETIEALTEYHKDIYSVDVAATTWNWPEKESQLKKLQDEFVQAVNRSSPARRALPAGGHRPMSCSRSRDPSSLGEPLHRRRVRPLRPAVKRSRPSGAWKPCNCPRRHRPSASHSTPRVSTTVRPRPSPRFLRFRSPACWPSNAAQAPHMADTATDSDGTLDSHHSTPPSRKRRASNP
jgi:hypothetical protein